MRLLAVLDELADDRDARGAQELGELGQVVAVRHRRDRVGALLGAALGWLGGCGALHRSH